MQVETLGNELVVSLSVLEQVLSLHPGGFRIPREQVERAHVDWPHHGWRQIRVPGAFLPGIIKSGTYRWVGRREFWLVHRWQPGRLVIELKPFARYDRLVLAVADADAGAERINAWLGDAA